MNTFPQPAACQVEVHAGKGVGGGGAAVSEGRYQD